MYIVRSCRIEKYYIGSTADLESRVAHHNGPDAGWTKRYQPWTVVYIEEHETRGEAMRRERFLKSKAGIAEKMRILEEAKRNPYGLIRRLRSIRIRFLPCP